MTNFDPLQNRHPSTDSPKFVTVDYIGETNPYAKVGANPPTEVFCGIGWSVTIFIYTPFSGNSPSGQTRRRIFALDDLNDKDSHKVYTFCCDLIDIVSHWYIDIAPIWGCE